MKADLRRFELFDASTEERPDELGLAWIDSHNEIVGQALSDYLVDEDDRKEFTLTLGFSRPSEAIWPLPSDPTKESFAEWEAGHGPLLTGLEEYFSRRTCLPSRNHYTLLATWTIAAALRSTQMRFAPSILVRAPFSWGKSAVAEALALVIPRTVYGGSITPAAVYRTVSEYSPAFVVDESAIADNPDLQRVIRIGFKRGPKIIRARQNADRGIVTMDPWAWLILTIPVDPVDDIMSRCFPIDLTPGEPEVALASDDPEARLLRTVLTRLRLEHAAGIVYPDLRAVMKTVRAVEGLETRTKDRLESLWPIAVRYGVTEAILDIAKETESVAQDQYAVSDKGLVVSALEQLLIETAGKLKAGDLEVSAIHRRLTDILVAEGEGQDIAIRKGFDEVEIVRKLDRKYGVRDFTSKNLRALGFRVKVVMGRARVDLASFQALWASVRRRYLGVSVQNIPTIPTIDIYSKGESETVGIEKSTPTTPLLTVGISRDKTGGPGPPGGLSTPLAALRRRAREILRYDPRRPLGWVVFDVARDFRIEGDDNGIALCVLRSIVERANEELGRGQGA